MKKLLFMIVAMQFLIVNFAFAKNYDLKDAGDMKVIIDYTINNYADKKTVEDLDTIKLGKDGDGKDIEWVALEKEDGKIFLLSKYAIDCKSYNETQQDDITWEKCSLREYLNKTFYDNAFSSSERELILTTDVVNNDIEKYGTKSGNDTKDKIYLLSVDEVKKYVYQENMQTDNYRIATKGTDYAKGVKNHSGHLYVEKEKNKWFTGNTYFWLRTIGAEQVKASVVYEYGYLNEPGVYVDARDCGVRPCMWISVNGAKASSTKEENKKDSNDEETKKKNNKVEEKNDSSKSNSTDNFKNIKNLKLASTYDEDTTDKKMDFIKFGKSKNGEDIEWIVLYRDDKKALLLTKYLSVVNPYFEDDNINNVNKKATWETSTIREWLNTKYYNETFSNSEKEYIILSKLETTSDNVFLLSVDEVNKYLKKTKARSSDFASADSWWLRTTGQDEKFAAFVKNDGKIDEDGAFINSDKSTRPAIWVSLTGSVSSKETSLENKKENKEELKNETKEKTTNEKDNKDEKNANNNDEYFTGWDEGHYYKDGKEYSLEWLNEDGKWYYLTENGTYAKDGWLNIENDYYYFNKDGTLAADQWIVEKTKLADGKTMVDSYYVGLDGKMWRNAITPDGFTVDANGLYREYK